MEETCFGTIGGFSVAESHTPVGQILAIVIGIFSLTTWLAISLTKKSFVKAADLLARVAQAIPPVEEPVDVRQNLSTSSPKAQDSVRETLTEP